MIRIEDPRRESPVICNVHPSVLAIEELTLRSVSETVRSVLRPAILPTRGARTVSFSRNRVEGIIQKFQSFRYLLDYKDIALSTISGLARTIDELIKVLYGPGSDRAIVASQAVKNIRDFYCDVPPTGIQPFNGYNTLWTPLVYLAGAKRMWTTDRDVLEKIKLKGEFGKTEQMIFSDDDNDEEE